jgi:hypothetical protein
MKSVLAAQISHNANSTCRKSCVYILCSLLPILKTKIFYKFEEVQGFETLQILWISHLSWICKRSKGFTSCRSCVKYVLNVPWKYRRKNILKQQNWIGFGLCFKEWCCVKDRGTVMIAPPLFRKTTAAAFKFRPSRAGTRLYCIVEFNTGRWRDGFQIDRLWLVSCGISAGKQLYDIDTRINACGKSPR